MDESRRVAVIQSRLLRSLGHSNENADEAVLRVHEALIDLGVLAPVGRTDSDTRLWVDCELASLAENRLGDHTDPRTLEPARRADWLARASTETPLPPEQRGDDRCYWIRLGASERVGCVAISTAALDGNIWVSDLFLFPGCRGRGLACAVLTRIRDLAHRQGLGLRLSVEWTWQRALGMCLRMGMWVRMWKRDIDLRWSGAESAPIVRMDGEQATLSVLSEGEPQVLCRAIRIGARLRLEVPDRNSSQAPTTLAVWLATHGWPLLSGDPDWIEGCAISDLVDPEALASRISIWEAWSRQHGWLVNAPRIPGLEYPTWEQLETRWR